MLKDIIQEHVDLWGGAEQHINGLADKINEKYIDREEYRQLSHQLETLIIKYNESMNLLKSYHKYLRDGDVCPRCDRGKLVYWETCEQDLEEWGLECNKCNFSIVKG